MRKNVADWTCTWGRHMKSPQFKEIKESQKINHFPGKIGNAKLHVKMSNRMNKQKKNFSSQRKQKTEYVEDSLLILEPKVENL